MKHKRKEKWQKRKKMRKNGTKMKLKKEINKKKENKYKSSKMIIPETHKGLKTPYEFLIILYELG